MRIRPATRADAAELFGLVEAFATSFEPAPGAVAIALDAVLADQGSLLVVAEDGNRLVGYLTASARPALYASGEVCWVEELMVDAGRRRAGTGLALMTAAEQWATGRGCRYVCLATRRAGAFYEALGYERSADFFRKFPGVGPADP